VPSAPNGPARSASVRKRQSGPRRSKASTDVNIFIVDAGTTGVSGSRANSVSPRVSDTTITPHRPSSRRERRLPSAPPSSAALRVAT
jgi:hypothetical protein